MTTLVIVALSISTIFFGVHTVLSTLVITKRMLNIDDVESHLDHAHAKLTELKAKHIEYKLRLAAAGIDCSDVNDPVDEL